MHALFRGFLFLPFIVLSGCGAIRTTPRHAFTEGMYTSTQFSNGMLPVYLTDQDSAFRVYPMHRKGSRLLVDTSRYIDLPLTLSGQDTLPAPQVYRMGSFDLDFLTMPFKFRPSLNGFPRQFNTSLNGAVYAGYRTDRYLLRYRVTPLHRAGRKVTRFGFSFGGFSGLGATPMNPWVTSERIGIEYDGMVWTKGIASIIGLNQITVGLAVGWDHLLDRNRPFWIYQQKPWIGFAFGLNIN